MTDGYTVDVDALDDMEQQLGSYLKLATDNLSRVEGLIARLSQAWEGAGGSAYQSRHHDWASALGEMKEQLAELKKWAGQADAAYREAMAINLRMARA